MKTNFSKYMHKLKPDMTKAEIKCIMKTRFKTKKQALTGQSESRNRAGKKLRIYKCPECRCYHLTKQEEN